MSEPVRRSYGGVTAAERQAQRQRALFEATLDVLAESGVAAVTKKSVCSRARLNDRYFYELFADRDALLRSVAEDLTAQGLQAVTAVVRPGGPRDVRAQVHAAAEAAVAFMTADPRRAEVLLQSHADPVLQQARLTSTRSIATAMAALSHELLGAAAPSQLDSDLVCFTVVSGTMELVSGWLRGDFDVTPEHLIDLVAALLLKTPDLSAELPSAIK